MLFLFFFYCKSNSWGCFQSYRVFRNEPEYRQTSYSTKSRAVGLHRHLVFMYLCGGFVELSLSALEQQIP